MCLNCLGDEDLDRPELQIKNDSVLSADDALDRKETEDDKNHTMSIDDFRIIKVKV